MIWSCCLFAFGTKLNRDRSNIGSRSVTDTNHSSDITAVIYVSGRRQDIPSCSLVVDRERIARYLERIAGISSTEGESDLKWIKCMSNSNEGEKRPTCSLVADVQSASWWGCSTDIAEAWWTLSEIHWCQLGLIAALSSPPPVCVRSY